MRQYSEHAFQSLSSEWQPYIPDMTDLLLGFFGSMASLTYEEIRRILTEVGVKASDVEKVIRFLIECNFLGLAVDENNYRFALSPTQATLMYRQAGRFVHQRSGERRFRIHKAFHDCLSINS